MTAAAFAAAMTFASCDGGSSSEGEPANDIITSKTDSVSSIDTDLSSVPEYDPSSEAPQPEYDAPIEYDPSSEEPTAVYGPPKDMED